MDSMDLEREKGITILAKNTAIRYPPADGEPVTINIIDTPGHADFGGEVERGLTMVDGVLLLVDASEGPLPQTRFVLRKALKARLPIILVINKVDRPDARIKEVVDDTYELFLDLDADEQPDRLPDRLRLRPRRRRLADPAGRRHRARRTATASSRCSRRCSTPSRRPRYTEGAPLQAHVTNLDASPFLGRLALCRVHEGTIRKGQTVAWCRTDGTVEQVRISELLMTEGLERKPAEQAGPGDIIAVAGIPEIMIGETLADAENPVPLPLITVDEPAISMTIGTNTSPLVGRVKGGKVTARHGQGPARPGAGRQRVAAGPAHRAAGRLGGAGPRRAGAGHPGRADAPRVLRADRRQAAGGHPEIDGKMHEPVERLTIDAPEEYLGAITQLLATRKGRMEQLVNHGTGWIRMEWLVPARGLIGFRTEFLTDTRGTGILHHVFEAYEPWFGELRTRNNGSLVADRAGAVTAFAMTNLQERGQLFVEPDHRGVRGHDRRRELPRRRHGRQHHQGEEAHQHAVSRPPTRPRS